MGVNSEAEVLPSMKQSLNLKTTSELHLNDLSTGQGDMRVTVHLGNSSHGHLGEKNFILSEVGGGAKQNMGRMLSVCEKNLGCMLPIKSF